MASSSLQEYQLDSSSVATVEGSSSEASLRKKTTTNTNTNTKHQQQNKKNISIPNPLVPTPTADDDDASKAANPKRVRAENRSVVHVSSKKKKSSAPTVTLQVVDVKKKTGANSKPPLSAGRIWSEEDEIVILEGYLSYMEDKMKYNDKAKYNAKEFYIYIKDRLSHAGYWTQLRDKVKHLHDKCRTQFAASKNSPIKLKTPHDTMVYNLSMKAWRDTFGTKTVKKGNFEDGGDGDEPLQGEDQAEAGAGADKLNEKKVQAASVAVEEDDDDDYVDDRVVPHGLRDYFRSELFDGRWVDDDQLRSLETKWKKLQVSRANYKSAKSQFKAMVYQLAVQGYNMNMM